MKPLNPFDVTFGGTNLVEASAGTGKTYNITSLYIRALIERDISVGNILVVTYTEAATKELKDRLLKRIRESIETLKTGASGDGQDQFLSELVVRVDDRQGAVKQLEEAARHFDQAAIYTIHGFCYQSLQEQAFESRGMYDAEMIGDDSELVREAVDDYWRKWVEECTDNQVKTPLLKLLFDNGYRPEVLAQELAPAIGKPYMHIIPDDIDDSRLEQKLTDLKRVFSELQGLWKNDRNVVLRLLSQDMMSNYRSDWLEGWMNQMDTLLHSDTASIAIFDQFKKFTQSQINNSLTKKAVENGNEPPKHPFFDLADTYRQLAESLQSYEVIFKKNLFFHLRDELQQKKEEQQVLSYDDLLLQLRRALNDEKQGARLAEKLRTKYPIALVDEFQDTDPNQYEIFRSIYKSKKESALFMIGDPKQSIYSFRGADVFSYLEAKKDAPQKNIFNLRHNFRSNPELLKGINALFEHHSNPFIFDQIAFEPVKPGKNIEDYDQLKENGETSPPIRFRRIRSDKDQLNKGAAAEKAAHDTADEISRLIQGGKEGSIGIGAKPVQARDIAVLVRTHKQAELISEALQDKGIKSVQYSQQSVFNSEEARQLESFLKAVAQPGNESRIRTALALPLTPFSATDLYYLEENEDRWLEIREQFSTWNKKWQDQGFSSMFRSILREAEIAEHVISFTDGERRFTNILHLGELLQHQQQQHNREANALLKWFAYKRNEESKNKDEEQLRLESDEDLVKIVTMHRSKGLEYSIVFCPFLWYGPKLQDRGEPLIFHEASEFHKTYMDFTGKAGADRDQNRWLSAREELAESMRLAYVAVTRAKQCCYLTWTYARKSEFSPLALLLLGSKKTLGLLKETIFEKYQPQGGEQMREAMRGLCEACPELFTMKRGFNTVQNQLELPGQDQAHSLNSRSFQRGVPLKNSYGISSFSSLTNRMAEDPDRSDYDQFLDVAFVQKEEPVNREKSMFTFPKGPQPGTCIHKIFEEIDFSNTGDRGDLIAENLSLYGIDEHWKTVVAKMIHTVVNIPLLEASDSLKMSVLPKEDLLAEMEFYFSNKELKSQQLFSIIRSEDHAAGGRAEPGFLKGFIDLTFRFEGKYYLLDYKTNYLGDSYNDYSRDILQQEMHEASYDLQYHIYTIALHRFLSKKLADYSYKTHFGGVFYLFLRGMNRQGREGIFYDRPDFSLIRKLNNYMGRHHS